MNEKAMKPLCLILVTVFVGCGQSAQDRIAIAELKDEIEVLIKSVEEQEEEAKNLADPKLLLKYYKEGWSRNSGSEPTPEEIKEGLEEFTEMMNKTAEDLLDRAKESRADLEKKKKLLSEIE